jgi:hypothetical protein
MKIEYKGVTIKTVHGVYTAMGKEYASIAGAKGAITRWVNANVEAVQKQDNEKQCLIAQMDGYKISHPQSSDFQSIEMRIATQTKNDNAESAKVYAECVYHGLFKHGKAVHSQKYLSRNKREGKYAGKAWTYNPDKRNGRIAGQHKRQGKDNVWPSNLK